MTHYITNDLAVDQTKAVELADNGRTGDARVTLVRAPCVVGEWLGKSRVGEPLTYLETNGGPMVPGDDRADRAAVASDLGISLEVYDALIDG